MLEAKLPSPTNSSGFMVATMMKSGRSRPAAASAACAASAMRSPSGSLRRPTRVIPAPAIQTFGMDVAHPAGRRAKGQLRSEAPPTRGNGRRPLSPAARAGGRRGCDARATRGAREMRAVSARGRPPGAQHAGRRAQKRRALAAARALDSRVRRRASGLRGGLHPGMVLEELLVQLDVVLPLLWRLVFREDRLHRTDGLARATVDALVRMDEEHRVALVNAVDGANLDTGFVFHVDAGLGNDIRH